MKKFTEFSYLLHSARQFPGHAVAAPRISMGMIMHAFRKAALCLAIVALSHSSHAAVIFSNLTHAKTSNIAVTVSQWVATKANVGASALTVDSFVANVWGDNTTAPLAARVCADNAGVPNLTRCSSFTTTDTITGTAANISYSGTYSAAANATVWIVLNSSGAGAYLWSTSNTAARPFSNSYDSGSTWQAQTTEVIHSISGSTPATPVPTLSEWALIAFASLIVGFGVYQQRRRQR